MITFIVLALLIGTNSARADFAPADFPTAFCVGALREAFQAHRVQSGQDIKRTEQAMGVLNLFYSQNLRSSEPQSVSGRSFVDSNGSIEAASFANDRVKGILSDYRKFNFQDNASTIVWAQSYTGKKSVEGYLKKHHASVKESAEDLQTVRRLEYLDIGSGRYTMDYENTILAKSFNAISEDNSLKWLMTVDDFSVPYKTLTSGRFDDLPYISGKEWRQIGGQSEFISLEHILFKDSSGQIHLVVLARATNPALRPSEDKTMEFKTPAFAVVPSDQKPYYPRFPGVN